MAAKNWTHRALGIANRNAYGVSLLLIALMGLALYYATNNARVSSERVDRSLLVLESLSGISGLLARIESAQRGFLLYGQDRFVEEREALATRLTSEIAHLKGLFSEHPSQHVADDLATLAQQRLSSMALAVNLKRANADMQTVLAATGQGMQLSARFFALVDGLREQELKLLEDRRWQAAQTNDTLKYVLFGVIVVFAAVVVPGYAGFVRQTRARLRAERQMSDLAESLPGAVLQYRIFPDGKSRYEFITRGAKALRGIDLEAAQKDPEVVLRTILPEDRPRLERALSEATKTLRPVQVDYRVRDGNGVTRWIRTSAAPRRERDGSTLFNAHWADVTAEKDLEAELRRAMQEADSASRAKSTFLATMSHEIRTPMNGVLGMLELLSLTRLDNEQQTTLSVVRQSGKALLRIIDDILDFSKVEAGKLDIRPEPASLRDVVERVRNIYTGTASSKGLLLASHVDPRLAPLVMVDAVRLQQVLNNLVSNAVKFTHRGEVGIGVDLVRREEGHEVVRFTVTDTGTGVSEQDLARLFQPFSQAVERVDKRHGGTGLGLSISRRLIELMGGTIEMESQPGVGSRVIATLRLPIAEGELPAAAAASQLAPLPPARPAPSIEQAEAEGTLVLLVDDHPINRLVLERQLRLLGYAAEIAVNGAEALDKWSTDRFGAVITDCNMPEMSGYELAREIRACEARHGHSRTPLIACTANALGGEAERCYAEGMDDYLPKPVELATLAQKLQRWLPLPTVDTPASVPVLDREILREISAGDEAAARETLARFREYNEQDAAALQRAAEARDLGGVVQAAHRIKGSSRTIGANVLGEACEQLERAGRAGQWEEVAQCLPRVRAEIARLHAHIAEEHA